MRVCQECIADDGLRGVVNTHADFAACDFCEKQIDNPRSCELDVVVDHMRKCFDRDFVHLSEVEDRDKEFLQDDKKPFNGFELFRRVNLEISNERLLTTLVANFLGEPWCERRWFALCPSQEYEDLWVEYCGAVRKYVGKPSEQESGLSIEVLEKTRPDILNMLKKLGDIVAGTCISEKALRLWRVQVLKRFEVPNLPYRFTSPPPEFAKWPGRMNRAGVSVFYGADDLHTAYEETVTEPLTPDKVAWATQFECVRPLEILRLQNEILLPSYFGNHGSQSLHESWFFDAFLEEVSRPVDRAEQPHVDYAPTQLMADFFLKRVITLNQGCPDGVMFSSSKTGRPSYAIFADCSQCLDDADHTDQPQFLRMVPDSLRFLANSLDSEEGART